MDTQKIHAELSSIRSLMERSAKFISLSGLSGVLAGIYALIGAVIGYREVYGFGGEMDNRDHYVTEYSILLRLCLVALAVLLLSLVTAYWLSARKARAQGQQIWNQASRGMLKAVAVPLLTGGFFILIQIARGSYGIVAPACLLFYGLALIAGSQYTYKDVKWLGMLQIVLGLLAACFPGYGIVFWTVGFSFLHIIYGIVMYVKYERRAA